MYFFSLKILFFNNTFSAKTIKCCNKLHVYCFVSEFILAKPYCIELSLCEIGDQLQNEWIVKAAGYDVL